MTPRTRRWLDRWLQVALLGAAWLSPTPALAIGFATAWVGLLLAPAARSAGGRRAAARARRAVPSPVAPAAVVGTDPAGQPVQLSDAQLAAHALIVGASGAGKSTTLLTLLESRVGRGDPVIAIDLKGSPAFAAALRAQAARAGRGCAVFTLAGGRHWNPLAHGSPTALKDKLISSERFTEPHYQRLAERYLQTALQVQLALAPERAPTLAGLIRLMEPRRLGSAIERVPEPLRDRVEDYLASLGRDGLSAVRGAATRLALLSESDAGPWLEPGAPDRTIDLPAALAGGDVVLFSLNSSVYGKLAAQLGALAIQNLVSAAGERMDATQAPPPAVLALDEFSALGADNVLALLARGRESGMSVLLATQELADLERAGRGFTDQVLGITGVKIAHRQDVPASALLFAQMAGTHQVWEETEVVRNPFSAPGAPRGSRRLVERHLVHPNEIKTLPTGQAVILAKLPATEIIRARIRPPAPAAPDAARGAQPGSGWSPEPVERPREISRRPASGPRPPRLGSDRPGPRPRPPRLGSDRPGPRPRLGLDRPGPRPRRRGDDGRGDR